MALSLILEQAVGHFTIDRIADFFYTGRTTIKTEMGVGYILRIYNHLFHKIFCIIYTSACIMNLTNCSNITGTVNLL